MNLSYFYKVAGLLGTFVLFALVFVSSAQESSNSGKNLFLDFDQDGLSNDEESVYGTDPYKADTDGDGYSDYVEITGGYDPLKPAPGDRIIKTPESAIPQISSTDGEKNLTQDVATKLAGVVSANTTDGSITTLADIEKIVQESVQENTSTQTLPEIDMKRIKIKDQSYKGLSDEDKKTKIKEDAQEYLSAISYILLVQFPQLTSEKEADPMTVAEGLMFNAIQSVVSGNTKDIDAFAEAGQKTLDQFFDVEVPETLADIHVKGIQFAEYAQTLKNTIKIQSGDPLESVKNISQAQGLLISAQEFFTSLQNRLIELGVSFSLESSK